MSELSVIQDKVVELTTTIHKKQDELEADGKKMSEGMEKAQADIAKSAEELQGINLKQEALEKEMKTLEAMIARGGGNGDPQKTKGNERYLSQFRDFMRGLQGEKGNFTEEAAGLIVEDFSRTYGLDTVTIQKAGLVGSNPDGGYVAPIDVVREIMRRMFESSPVRAVANVLATSSEAVQIILDDEEADAGWVGEVDTRDDTEQPGLGEVIIPAHEMFAQPPLSQKVIDDAAINLESWLQDKVARRFARLEATGFVIGDGVKKPRGFLDYGEWANSEQYERDALATIQTATANTLDADDLINTQGLQLEDWQPDSVWMMHRQIWTEVLKLKDGFGQYLINPQLLFTGSQLQLLGKPVFFAGDMPNALTDNAKIIAYGDFSEGYTIIDRIGIRVLRDPYTKKGFVRFYTTRRVGGAVTNYQTIKILKSQAV